MRIKLSKLNNVNILSCIRIRLSTWWNLLLNLLDFHYFSFWSFDWRFWTIWLLFIRNYSSKYFSLIWAYFPNILWGLVCTSWCEVVILGKWFLFFFLWSNLKWFLDENFILLSWRSLSLRASVWFLLYW